MTPLHGPPPHARSRALRRFDSWALALLLASLMGCGSSSATNPSQSALSPPAPPPSAQSPATGTLAVSAPVFVLGAFTLRDEQTGIEASVDADGQMALIPGATQAPRFTEAGKIVSEGSARQLVSSDGSLLAEDGSVLGTIAEDGSANIMGHALHFDSQGLLVGGTGRGPQMRLIPAHTPAKRLAMAVVILLTL